MLGKSGYQQKASQALPLYALEKLDLNYKPSKVVADEDSGLIIEGGESMSLKQVLQIPKKTLYKERFPNASPSCEAPGPQKKVE